MLTAGSVPTCSGDNAKSHASPVASSTSHQHLVTTNPHAHNNTKPEVLPNPTLPNPKSRTPRTHPRTASPTMSTSHSSRDPRRTSTAPKRTSLLPRPSSIAIDPTALIAQHAQLTGVHPITIGPGAVLHPHSKINSTGSVVMLGEGCVVFERARVGVADVDGGRPELSRRTSGMSGNGNGRGDGVVLGSNVVVETGAVVEASEVGEGSTIESGAVVGRGAVVGKVCSVD